MKSKYTEAIETAEREARAAMNQAEASYNTLRNAWCRLYDLVRKAEELDKQAEVALGDMPADPLGMANAESLAEYADKHG